MTLVPWKTLRNSTRAISATSSAFEWDAYENDALYEEGELYEGYGYE